MVGEAPRTAEEHHTRMTDESTNHRSAEFVKPRVVKLIGARSVSALNIDAEDGSGVDALCPRRDNRIGAPT